MYQATISFVVYTGYTKSCRFVLSSAVLLRVLGMKSMGVLLRGVCWAPPQFASLRSLGHLPDENLLPQTLGRIQKVDPPSRLCNLLSGSATPEESLGALLPGFSRGSGLGADRSSGFLLGSSNLGSLLRGQKRTLQIGSCYLDDRGT